MNIRRFLFKFLLLLLCSGYVVASDNSLGRYRYNVKNLLSVFPDAVELNIIYQIYEDKSGFIWFATENGLIRFDGYQLKYYLPEKNNKSSIAHYHIKCIAGDKAGNMWVGLYRNGVDCFNPKTNSFKHYPIDKANPKTEIYVKYIFVNKHDEVWVITSENKLAQLNKSSGDYTQFEVATPQNTPQVQSTVIPKYSIKLTQMIDGDHNDFWISSAYGLYHFDKKTGQSTSYYTTGPREEAPIISVGPLVKLGDNIYMGKKGTGLRRFNIKTKEWKVFLFSPLKEVLFDDNNVNDIEIKDDDELWLATGDKGLGVFNVNTNQFSFFCDDSEKFKQLPVEECNHIFQDSRKNLWVTQTNKLLRIAISNQYVYKQTLNSKIAGSQGAFSTTDILEESTGNYLLVGTTNGDGLYVINRKTGITETFNFPVTMPGDKSLKVCRIIEINNNLFWVLTRDLLMLFDLKKKSWIKVNQPPLYADIAYTNMFVDATFDADSNLWLSTESGMLNGLIFYNSRSHQYKLIEAQHVNNTRYFSNANRIFGDKQNRIWFRNRVERMSGFYDIKTNTEVIIDEFGKPSERASNSITLTAGKNGKMLNATDIGLLIYDVSQKEVKLTKNLNAASGLKSDMIEFQSEDRDGNIWYICNDAVYRYDIKKNLNELFSANDAITDVIGPIKCGNDSLVYGLSKNGFYIFNLNRIVNDSIISNITLTSFQIDGKEFLYKNEMDDNMRITVPANYSYLSFEFANLDFAHTDNMSYSYKLKGIDDNWINSGQRRSASYTNLPGGAYTLFVRCALGNNHWNDKVLEVPIFIDTVFYKTIWFKLSAISVIALLLFIVYRYRTKQQQEIEVLNNRAQLLEKEKSVVQYENLKQQLNPHFLFNSLTSLSSLIATEPKIARQFVDQMSKIYRYILKSNENETVLLINEINFATTYVKLQQTRFPIGFEVNFNVGEEYHHRKIVPVTIQNLIENAIKHNIIDEESPLVIEIFVEEDYLIVKNNLQKKNIVETSNKHGLNQMLTLYKYLIDKPIVINETVDFFEIKIPLI